MRRALLLVFSIGSCAVTSGCSNTVYGPRRIISVDEIDAGPAPSPRSCPFTPVARADGTPINLAENFYDKACSSLRAENDVLPAREMMDAGVTLTRMRCNDFFAERAGHQTQERVVRRSVAPISALLTGIIGVLSFKSDAGRQQAVQILSIGQTATVAGLELYESEFLFGASNINSVRTLTMRALDEHAKGILDTQVGFYGAARHLIDHQMICTPANILELSQSAIREGRVEPTKPPQLPANKALAGDRAIISTLGANLRVPNLNADQLGNLWWLAGIARAGGTPDQNALAVIKDRLSALPLNPVTGQSGSLTIDTALLNLFTSDLAQLSGTVTNGFYVSQKLLERKISLPTPADLIERTKDIRFELPPGSAPPASGAVEVGVPSASASQN